MIDPKREGPASTMFSMSSRCVERMENGSRIDMAGVSLGSVMGWLIVVCALLVLAVVLLGPALYAYGRVSSNGPLPTRYKVAMFLVGAVGLWFGIPVLIGGFYS